MEKIVKKDGYVYLVKGRSGFETWYNMGKDIDAVEKPKRKRKKKEGS